MKVTANQTEKLLRSSQKFSQLGFSMLLTRLKSKYASEPSDDLLQTSTAEINAFLEKFKAIMGSDYNLITKL